MTILDQILATKREEIAASRKERTLAELDALARSAGPTRGLQAALRRGYQQPMRVLAEIKRASPSAGAIRKGADPAQIARAYEAGGASAISVLTDKTYFDGDLAFLAQVRNAVALPLLRKDFIIDAYQVVQARAAGADAILLIVAALSRDELSELHAAARAYDLDVLVEVHDRAEAELAVDIGASLVGVNHRNLKTFEIDMTLTAQLAPVLAGNVLVAESGIKTADDIRRLGESGAHAVLVGEQLMRAPNPGDALRQLIEGC